MAVEKLQKEFAPQAGIWQVSFCIPGPGSWFGLAGPSGCGKSTLLKLIAGVDSADSGLILLRDQDVTRQSTRRRKAVLVWQEDALFQELSVIENIRFGNPNISSAEIKSLCEMFKISDSMLDRLPRSLSGGEKQRVALVRAYATDSDLLLLDEPLAHLDSITHREIVEALLTIKSRKPQRTVLLVSHDQDDLFTLADCMLVFDVYSRGECSLVEQGTPARLLYRPQDIRTAKIIGRHNLLHLERDGEQYRLADLATLAFVLADDQLHPSLRGGPNTIDLVALLAASQVMTQPARGLIPLDIRHFKRSLLRRRSYTEIVATHGALRLSASLPPDTPVSDPDSVTDLYFNPSDLWVLPG